MPILMGFTLFASGDPIMVNVSKVQTISPMKDFEGCTLIFDDGRKIAVKESPDEIWRRVAEFITNI